MARRAEPGPAADPRAGADAGRRAPAAHAARQRAGPPRARKTASRSAACRGAMGLDPRAWWRLRSEHPSLPPRHHPRPRQPRPDAGPGARRASAATLIAHRRVDFHVRPGSAWFRADALIAVSRAVQQVLVADGIPPCPDHRDPRWYRSRRGAQCRRPPARHPRPARSRRVHPARRERRRPRRPQGPAHPGPRGRVTLVPPVPDLHWVIAGEGELRRTLEREIAELGIGDRVHLVGYVPEADALIREATVVVMSSKEEGMGSVILDALALEKPVVATAAGGIPEVLPPRSPRAGGRRNGAGRESRRGDHPSPFPRPPSLAGSQPSPWRRPPWLSYQSLV